jgi:tetratricopeptide (TPR) repeat protein
MAIIQGRYPVKRLLFYVARTCCLLIAVLLVAGPSQGKDSWTKVQSRNFLLVGNASEKEIREVAVRLEQFREGFGRLLTGFRQHSPLATTVIVFKSSASFDPFKPLYQGRPSNVAGYFQSGEDVNYITLTTEPLANDPFQIIFHEYVHLLLHNNVPNVPPWLDEGLAEYYSTFAVEEKGRRVVLGRVISNHLALLHRDFISLETLLAVDRKSPYYNERDKTGVFYAQSWALLHYLMLGNERKRQPQLGTFLELLRSGAGPDRAFKEAFQTDPPGLELELRNYLRRNIYPLQTISLKQGIKPSVNLTSAQISDAEARAYLGDLLLHTDRLSEASEILQQALLLDPQLSLAHESLGIVRVKQKRFAEAIEHLKKAQAANPTNYLTHYYHAFALSRMGMDDGLTVTAYEPRVADIMRSELRRAMELNREFPESYSLLAFVNLVQEERLDESIDLIGQALALAPGRNDYVFVLAQLYMRKQDFVTARKVLTPMLRENADETTRRSALTLLNSMKTIEEQLDRLKAANAAVENVTGKGTPQIEAEPPLEHFLRKVQKGEQRVQGFLNRVECTGEKILFSISAGSQILTLQTSGLERVRFVTFTPDVRGEISCGQRRPPNPVVVTYRKSAAGVDGGDGEIVVVEFVPADFYLQSP